MILICHTQMTKHISAEEYDKTIKESLTAEQYEAFKNKMMRSALITKFLFAFEPIEQKDALMKVLMHSSDATVSRILAFTTDVMQALVAGISSGSGSDSEVEDSSDSDSDYEPKANTGAQ